MQLAAVNWDGYNIAFIKKPSEAVQLAAVKQDGENIEYIINPSEAVQLAAVKGNGFAFRYIKNPSDKVKIAALKKFPLGIAYLQQSFPPDIINECRYEILRCILTEIKNGNVDNAIKILKKIKGINWPELNTIQQSINNGYD